MIQKTIKLVPMLLLFWASFTKAQDSLKNVYFESYPNLLTTRLYTVTKFNSIQFIGNEVDEIITYRPNTNLNVGFGFNYRAFGLNIGLRLPVLNNDDEIYGSTTHFNADANTYTKKMSYTAFFEFYKGYYVSGSDKLSPPGRGDESKVIRSDVSFYAVGASGVYVFNYDKVSLRSSFTQDEWQKLSAGSFLLGGFANVSGNKSDSALIFPDTIYDSTIDKVSKLTSVDIGPLVGYTYNFVFKEHWFASISLSAGTGFNYLTGRTIENHHTSRYNINWRLQGRLAIGYNSRRTYVGLAYVNENNRARMEEGRYGYNIGNFRINLVYRFKAKLGMIDKIMDTFHWFFQAKEEE